MVKWHLGWCVALMLLAAGCLLDDDRCGARQQELNEISTGCVCAPGSVPNPDGLDGHERSGHGLQLVGRL